MSQLLNDTFRLDAKLRMVLPLSHFGEFDCDSLRIEHFSVSRVSAHSQPIRSAFAVSLSAFAVESPTNKIFSTGSKIFQFAAQSPWSRIAVSVGSQCIRHQIDGNCAANALRTHGDCSTTLANARRLRCELR